MLEELLERYFDGETSAAEEKQIRAFFASGEVPEHLAAYAPLFAYFDEEIERDAEAQVGEQDLDPEPVSVPIRTANRKRTALYLFSGVAALSILHFSEPTRQAGISYAVFCLKKKQIRI